jgi:predicted phosphate transport protein (TIGR00153 family)
MNIDKFLKIFVPKDHSFFPLFEEDVHNLIQATLLLKELLSATDPLEHERIYKQIKDVEHKGDVITNKTYIQLNKSFITPFDREDIHELTAHIDDVLDTINGIGRRICLYKPGKLMPVYSKLADVIHLAALEVESAVKCLEDPVGNKSRITSACDKVTFYEHEADELYFSGVSEAFEKETNPKELLITNKLLELLERCVDEEEDVTDSLKAILIKMA